MPSPDEVAHVRRGAPVGLFVVAAAGGTTFLYLQNFLLFSIILILELLLLYFRCSLRCGGNIILEHFLTCAFILEHFLRYVIILKLVLLYFACYSLRCVEGNNFRTILEYFLRCVIILELLLSNILSDSAGKFFVRSAVVFVR